MARDRPSTHHGSRRALLALRLTMPPRAPGVGSPLSVAQLRAGRRSAYCTAMPTIRCHVIALDNDCRFLGVIASDEVDDRSRPVVYEVVHFMATDPDYKVRRIFEEVKLASVTVHDLTERRGDTP